MTESERVRYVVDVFEGGNAKRFADKVGISKFAASRMRTGRTSVRLHAAAIAAAYPLVSPAWLISGKGEPPCPLSDLERVERMAERLHEDLKKLNERLDEVERTHREIIEMYNSQK